MKKAALLNTVALTLLISLSAANAQTERDRNQQSPPSQNNQQSRDTATPGNAQQPQPQRDQSMSESKPTTAETGSQQTNTQQKTDTQQRTQNSAGSNPASQQNPTSADSRQGGTNAQQNATSSQQNTNPSQQSANPTNSANPSSSTTAPANAQNTQQPQSAPGAAQDQARASSQNNQSNTSVSLNEQQTKSISSMVARERVSPVTNVNFSVSVGTSVPRTIHVQPLSNEIVGIVPQYRGYSYFVTRDQLVIVEPSTYKMVTVLPYDAGGSASAAPPAGKRSVQFSQQQRQAIHKQVLSRPVQGPAAASRKLVIGDEVPSSIVVEEFPETVYREVPEIRSYRYYRNDQNVVVVDPDRRTVVDVIE
jgi:hypothetical protein